ncbi:MAG: hypothetical protein HYV37_00355 [Candidatus Levyibacteriota bacterium]|nr:MAG: hypothetical protein HYV37_00355 [Candidatus Levybacteria bacterium]
MADKLISNTKRDKLLNKCESLMLQGVDSPTDISESLNVSFNTARSYVTIIKQRWSNYSNTEELQAKRQELIRKTEEVIKEAWTLKNHARNTLEAVGSLRTALMGIERLQKLLGIDSLPIPIEKPVEIQTFELAQEVIALPEEDKSVALSMIREEIKKRAC